MQRRVKSILMHADVTIEGVPFTPKAEIKIMSPNKESMEMAVEGMGVSNETKDLMGQQAMPNKGYEKRK